MMVNRSDFAILLVILIISVFADTHALGYLCTGKDDTACNKIDYMRWEDYCCKLPVMLPYDTSPLMAVCNEGKIFDPYVVSLNFDYVLNKYQNPYDNYQINWNSRQVSRELGPSVCLAECTFQTLLLFNIDGSVNNAALSLVLGNLANLAWKPTVLDAIAKCEAPLRLLKDVKLTVTDVTTGTSKVCGVVPFLYSQCVISYTIGRCPASLQPLKPPMSCTGVLKNIDNCTAIFNFPPLNG